MSDRHLLETEQKALEINLNPRIYGTFAEIGAGQEVARHFFQVGAAAGTIAKTMSAYDKVYSDQIYGAEPSGRYVCESRVYTMLDHEYKLMIERLSHDRPEATFFVFADTIAAINYARTIRGNGWLGLRFQLEPESEPNDLVLHVRMLDNDNQLQQQAIGVLGVNMVYAAYYYYDQPQALVQSLQDGLKGRIAIDTCILSGKDFEVDNRLLSLYLVKEGLTDLAMFNANGRPVHASETLYRKAIMVVRGSYRPATLVNEDMLKTSYAQFRSEPDVEPSKSALLTELTIDNLQAGQELDERDFLDRVKLLNALGHSVLLSNYKEYNELIEYFNQYKAPKIGIAVGVQDLLQLISDKYAQNRDGRILAAFGEIFTRHVKMYVYPAQQEGSPELMTGSKLPVLEEVKFLYRHLLDSGQIVDINGADSSLFYIFSKDVLADIRAGNDGWEDKVSDKVAQIIKNQYLFSYPTEKLVFDY
ncbi:MAG: TonB-dependent receptor [Bacteroidota bacterium]